MTDYLTPLEAEPVSGETVRLVESEKWSPIEQDWSYPKADKVEVMKGEPTPWEEHRVQGREALFNELQQTATHSIRAAKWANSQRQAELPDDFLTDIRSVSEKLRQMVKALS